MRNLPRHALLIAVLAGCGETSSDSSTPDAGNDLHRDGGSEEVDACVPGDSVCNEAPSASERNECEIGEHACDTSPAACVDLPAEQGGYACVCPSGFTGSGQGEAGCVAPAGEVDECDLGTHDCHPAATCIDAPNALGRYSCQCATGYEGEGHGAEGCQLTIPETEEVDECETSEHLCDRNPVACVDLSTAEGGYRCQCPADYVGEGVGDDGCRRPAPGEVNECLTGRHGCAPDACVDLSAAAGGFACECPNGYEGDGVGAQGCRDVDECADSTRCTDLQICVNAPGSFGCGSCSAGFVPGAGELRNTCVPEPVVGRAASLLEAGSSANASYFGRALAYEAGTLIVGAPEPYLSDESEQRIRYGFVYVFREQNGQFVHTQTLQGARSEGSSIALDKFGWQVALRNGLLVVGAPDDSRPAVYVFESTAQGFVLAQRIVSPTTGFAMSFGHDLAFDGTTLAVSDPDEGNGAVFVYTRQGEEFAFTQRIEGEHRDADLGQDIALGADQLAIAQRSSDSRWTGEVLVYRRTEGTFVQAQKLVGDGRSAPALAPEGLALDGDLLAVACRGSCIQVFALENGLFVPKSTLQDEADDEFWPGWGESLYLDEGVLLAGVGYNSNDDAVSTPISMFTRTGSTFAAPERFIPSANPVAFFNGATALRAGSRVIVGAPQAARPGQTTLRSGAVYVFE